MIINMIADQRVHPLIIIVWDLTLKWEAEAKGQTDPYRDYEIDVEI